MRAFLGIFLPKEIQSDFKSYKQQIRKQKQNLDFIPAPNIHLTLKYLGPDVQESTIDSINNIIPNILRNYEPFDIKLNKVVLGFPHDRFPKILNIRTFSNPTLDNLVNDIEHSLGGGQFKDVYGPKRDYIPHITIGELHGNIHKKKIGEVQNAINSAIWGGLEKTIPVYSIFLVSLEERKETLYNVISEYKINKTVI